VSTVSAFFSSANPHSAIGPSFRVQAEKHQQLIGCQRLERAVGVRMFEHRAARRR